MRLRYSRRALQQIDKALGYIAARSPQGAARVEQRITALTTLLRMQPNIGTRTRFPGVRRVYLIPYPYLIDYHASDDEIVVLRFRHTARKPI